MGIRSPDGVAAITPAQYGPLRAYLQFAAVVALLLLCYLSTARAMVSTWANSETYAHGFIVLPAAMWFAWRERYALASARRAPHWFGLLALACAASLWLLGELATARAPSQWALVLMLPAMVLAVFGMAWLRVLAFPLALLAFAVPFGDILVPVMTDWTADFTVAALRLSGVPVFREGNDLVIPSGHWSVVEACSGIRYLMASMFVGTLYAWTMYRSPLRRVAFIVASAVAPLIANWVRAYLIVLLGHMSGNQLATGVDHLIYGWIFFGIVIGLTLTIGARWREDDQPLARPPLASTSVLGRDARAWPVAVTALALVAGLPLLRGALMAPIERPPLRTLELAVPDWHRQPTQAGAWRPELSRPTRLDQSAFLRDGVTVTLTVGWFRDQRPRAELVTVDNRLVPERGTGWRQVASGRVKAEMGELPTPFHAASLRDGSERLRVWRVYWVGGTFEGSDLHAKLLLARDRLLRRDDTAAWVALAVTADDDAEADRVLAAFASTLGTPLRAALIAAGN